MSFITSSDLQFIEGIMLLTYQLLISLHISYYPHFSQNTLNALFWKGTHHS